MPSQEQVDAAMKEAVGYAQSGPGDTAIGNQLIGESAYYNQFGHTGPALQKQAPASRKKEIIGQRDWLQKEVEKLNRMIALMEASPEAEELADLLR